MGLEKFLLNLGIPVYPHHHYWNVLFSFLYRGTHEDLIEKSRTGWNPQGLWVWLAKHTSALQILLRGCPFLFVVIHLGPGWTPFSWFHQVLQLGLCLRHRLSFSKVSIRFIFVICILRKTTVRNSSTIISLIYYRPLQNSNELVMSLLHVREERSPISLSEKKTSKYLNASDGIRHRLRK